jgi:hypothetical protein
MQTPLREAYAAAQAAERDAWRLVAGRLPGTPAFDQKLWDDWQAAQAVTRLAANRLLDDPGTYGKKLPG